MPHTSLPHTHTILAANLELDAVNPLKSSLTFFFSHLIPSLLTLCPAFIHLRHCVSPAACNKTRNKTSCFPLAEVWRDYRADLEWTWVKHTITLSFGH